MNELLNFAVDGPDDAPVVLMGSSLGTTLSMWEGPAAALATSCRVVRFDHRGHGGSPVPAGPYTIEDLGRDVLALADHLGASRFHYAGVSLGGMVGMWLAAHKPDRVRRLVLLCASAFMDAEESWRERAAIVRTAGLESIADPIVSRWFTPSYRVEHPDVFASYRAGMVGTPAEGYAGCCEAIAVMDQRADLATITAPTLVVSAARDHSIPPDHGERIAVAVPGSRFEVLGDGAHLAAVQRSDLVTALLREHLAE